jgi:prephenate dehydrogenase
MYLIFARYIVRIGSYGIGQREDEKHIFDLASGGFSSTVRLAKSSADMWVPILTQNRDNVLKVIDTYIDKMKLFRDAIEDYDSDKVRELICEANKIKRIIR